MNSNLKLATVCSDIFNLAATSRLAQPRTSSSSRQASFCHSPRLRRRSICSASASTSAASSRCRRSPQRMALDTARARSEGSHWLPELPADMGIVGRRPSRRRWSVSLWAAIENR